MNYTVNDYLEELKNNVNKLFPPINYKFQRKALKNYTCEMCGCEIHKNELYYEYKSNPTYDKFTHKRIYYKWKKRCISCEPITHLELQTIKED